MWTMIESHQEYTFASMSLLSDMVDSSILKLMTFIIIEASIRVIF